MTFKEKLDRITLKNNSLVCVGLDTELEKLPKSLRNKKNPIFEFNKAIIDATADLVCAYKPQMAFYEAVGVSGISALNKTKEYIRKKYPDVPVILDAKRGDIGNTAEQYAREIFDLYEFDAVTVNPYLGFDSVEPFLKRTDKGVIILCRTSNPGAKDFQDLKVNGRTLYQKVALKIVSWDKKYGNCLMVMGATWPQELREVREIAPKVPFLVPGIGAQGGKVSDLKFGLNKEKKGLIINSSRGIIYASNSDDFAEAARKEALKLREEINSIRK